MSGYEFLMLIVKIIIISSMFFILRSYGLKALLKFTAVLIVIFVAVMYGISFNKNKQKTSPPSNETSPTTTKPIPQDIQNKINALKESISNTDESDICYLGREYDRLDMLQEAYDAFTQGVEKGFNECKTDLGMFYFNGRFVQKDWKKAGQLWTEAYNDDKFNETTNYNMAVYVINVYNDKQKYKYHLLKTTLIDENDEEAKMYLDNKLLENISATALFLKDAVGDYYYTPTIKGNKFSYGFDLYYRFKTMFNKKGLWIEDYEYKEEESIRYTSNGYDSIIFGLTKLRFETPLNPLNKIEQNNHIVQTMELLNNILFVDRDNLKEIALFIEQSKAKLALNKGFTLTQELSFFENYHFIYYASYDQKKGVFAFEIRINNK
jgi:hypothetical protein